VQLPPQKLEKVETYWSVFPSKVSFECWDLRLYRRPRGMFFSAADKGHMARASHGPPRKRVCIYSICIYWHNAVLWEPVGN